MKRDNCFDFLRFLFAFNVVLGHLMVIAVIPELQKYCGCFDTGLSVTGFFVISGFLISQSYERSTLKSYFTKRARRLLPAYFLVVIGCAIGLSALSTLPIKEYFCSLDTWKYLSANLCFANFLHPSLPGVFDNPLINDTSVNPALWTLKIEVGFYLVIPLLMYGLRNSKHEWIWLLIIYLCAIIFRNILNYLGDIREVEMYTFLARQLPGFMSYFAVGMAGYMYKNLFLRYKSYLIIPAIIIFSIEYYWGLEICTPLTWGIIVLWCAYSLPVFNNFAKYGDISYGIYIYHGPILKVLLTLGIFTQIGNWPATVIYITCVILIGLASWYLLENRFLHRK